MTEFNVDSFVYKPEAGIPPIGAPFPVPGKVVSDEWSPVAEKFKEYLKENGSPIADKFQYQSGSGKDRSQLGERYWADNLLGIKVFLPVKLGGIELPNPCISITGRMNIVETVMVSQEGTVKEEINTNDYDINIRCYVFDDSGSFPESLLNDLVKLWKTRTLLTIECVLTDFFLPAKNNCIITGISLPEQKGNEDMQIVDFAIRSDREYELILD